MLFLMKKFLFKNKANIAILAFALIGFFIFSSIFTYYYFAQDLKSKESIMNRNNTGIVLTDRNEVPFFTFYSAHNKTFVPLDQIPDSVIGAVISAEDKDFYNHSGFSLQGIIRASFTNVSKKDIVAGGSTITQQLVKNSLLSPRRDFLRKFQEVVLAQEIERRYTKNEILEMYLNSVYFGNGAFGIEAAADKYFGKSVSELTLAESALLAGVLPAPSLYSPYNGNEKVAKQRQEYVLNQMLEGKLITPKEKESAEKQKLVFQKNEDDLNTVAPHFAVMVRNELVKKFGEENIIRSGYKVRTTLDLNMQKYTEKIVAEEVDKLSVNNVSNGAAVVMDPKTGEVLSLVGSKDWFDKDFGKVNVAIQTRQPGSAFKPLVYAMAMEEQKITPASVLHDRPTTFARNYKPRNYDNRFRGNVLVRRALANSLNVPSVEIMMMLDMESVLQRAREYGITTLQGSENYGPSLVLGAAEVKLTDLTQVYSMFANEGKKNDFTIIKSISDKSGNLIYNYEPRNEQVISSQVAFLISSILADNEARAEVFGNSLNISREAAVKTGTTENFKDALTLGYTPQLAVGVWVGNNDGEPMDQVAGSLGAAPIWKNLMEEFHKNKPRLSFIPPENVVTLAVCSYNGLVARSANYGKKEYFLAGTQPTRLCNPPAPTRNPEDSEHEDGEHDDDTVSFNNFHRRRVREIRRELREIERNFRENRDRRNISE